MLPATTFLEHDDMYRAGGHSFFQVTRKVIEPYAQARENHYVICELAKRLGAKHRGFDLTAWELIDESLKLSGYPDAATLHRDHWIDRQPDFDTAHFINGFPTPDGKFRFRPDWVARGKYHAKMPVLPDYMADLPTTRARGRPIGNYSTRNCDASIRRAAIFPTTCRRRGNENG